MNESLKVVTWNIAGGHTIASLDHFDYEDENIQYFIDQLKNINPDIICLQEVHTAVDGSVSNAATIAQALGFKYVFNSPASPSHIADGYKLGTAIFSRENWVDVKEIALADPETELHWKDGRPAMTHHKNMQVVRFKHFSIVNNQMLPLKLFGLSYQDDSFGGQLAVEINKSMSEHVQDPVIWCGDFNIDNPIEVYAHIGDLKMKEALPMESTRPSESGRLNMPDHVLYSPACILKDAKIIHTRSDHYLCIVEFDMSNVM